MKHIICLISLHCFISCSHAEDLAKDILGRWKPVEKDAAFIWNFLKDGTLIVKADNGVVKNAHWKLKDPDLLEVPEFGADVASISIRDGTLAIKDKTGVHELKRIND
jgi:hypothetical protein